MGPHALSESLRETLALFQGSGAPRTTSEVAERLDLGRRSTYDRLERLVEHGHLETKKVGASARVWWRPVEEGTRDDSGEMLSRLIDNVPGVVYRCGMDPGWPMSFVSDAATDVTGYDPEQIVSGEVSWGADVIHPDDRTRVRAEVEAQLAESDQFAVEYRVRTADGDVRWVRERGCAVDGEESSTRLEGVVTDITEEKRSKQELVEREQQFRSLVEATEEYAIFMLDPEGYVQTWNSGAADIKGYDADEIRGEHFSTFYTETDRANGVPERNLAVAVEVGSVEDEGWRVRANGSRFWASVTITAVRDDDGDLVGYAKVTRDMTERREFEQRLQRERDLLERVLDTIPVGVAVLDDGEVVRTNEQTRAYFGDDGTEDSFLTDVEVYDADGTPVRPAERPWERARRTGEPVRDWLGQFDRPGGERRWLSVNAVPLAVEDGEVQQVVVSVEDVTQLKEQADHLKRRREGLEHELEAVLERVDDAFVALDDDWRFTYVNERAATLLDQPRNELVGRNVWGVFPEAMDSTFQEEYERARRSGESVTFEEYYPPLATWFEVRAYPSEDGLSVYFRDVTERKERERERRQYERIVETVDDGIYALDDDEDYVLVNEAFCEMVGYDREEILGSDASMLYDDEYVPVVEERAAAVAEGDSEVATIELELIRKDGSRVPVETRYEPFPHGDGYGRCGVVRDVTERLRRERELQRRIRQQEVVTDLGQRALEARDIDSLMGEATELVAETLDNEYCKVLDLDEEADELRLRQGVGWDDGIVGEATVSAVENGSQAARTLASTEPVVVEDLTSETRFSGPDLLVDHDVRSGISAVIGSPDDPWGILGTHDTDRAEFSRQDVTFVKSVATILATAISRHDDERALRRQREQLAALNSLNEVVRQIIDAVVDQSTREEVEQTVCERLAAAESYKFAWIGDVDATSQTVTLRTEAGVDGYLDETTISVDPDDERSDGPTGRAIRTSEIQTLQNIHSDPRYEPWRDMAEEYGFSSSAAIPIGYEGTTYGVLNVYTERSEAFEGQERTMLRQLGEVVGQVIAAAERKQALLSDEVVELEFQITNVFDALGVDADPTGTITLDHVVPVGDEEFLVYGTATADAVDTVERLSEALAHWSGVSFHDDEGETRFEVRLDEPPVLSVLASLGGNVDEAVIEDGDYRMTFQLSPNTDVRRVREAVREAYPSATMLRRQQVTRDDERGVPTTREVLSDLTERQRTALEAAYHAGFFQWPRDASGEDVADSLRVSPPTFHQHLRKAEGKVFSRLFGDATS